MKKRNLSQFILICFSIVIYALLLILFTVIPDSTHHYVGFAKVALTTLLSILIGFLVSNWATSDSEEKAIEAEKQKIKKEFNQDIEEMIDTFNRVLNTLNQFTNTDSAEIYNIVGYFLNDITNSSKSKFRKHAGRINELGLDGNIFLRENFATVAAYDTSIKDLLSKFPIETQPQLYHVKDMKELFEKPEESVVENKN